MQPGEAGHANVEKQHVGPMLIHSVNRGGAVTDDVDDTQLGLGSSERVFQRERQMGFVFRDQGRETGHEITLIILNNLWLQIPVHRG